MTKMMVRPRQQHRRYLAGAQLIMLLLMLLLAATTARPKVPKVPTKVDKKSKVKKSKKSSKKKKDKATAYTTDSPTDSPNTPVVELLSGNSCPATGGQTQNMVSQGGGEPKDVVCGAVQAVLAHPTDPNICFSGATNGGVWRTFSCTAAVPDWQPLTDQEESLSVGDMVFDGDGDGADPNTVIVAIGRRSSLGGSGGPGIGFLLSENALDDKPDWTVLDNKGGDVNFRTSDVTFNSVYMRGDLMLASSYYFRKNCEDIFSVDCGCDAYKEEISCETIGIFRSTDRGKSWKNVLQGIGIAIASDPSNDERFYATLDLTECCSGNDKMRNGVYTSDDNGKTWIPTSPVPNTPLIEEGLLNNGKLSVSEDESRVWSALVKNGQSNSTSYSDDFGDTWTKMDTVQTKAGSGGTLNPREKAGSQGSIHFALLASPTNKDIVYIAGDRQDHSVNGSFPNEIGAANYVGRLFRGNASVHISGDIVFPKQWEHLTNADNVKEAPGGGTKRNSAPHADARDMEVRADGVILESDDGGIAIRTSPQSNGGDWYGICGNMQVFEVHSVAYEPVRGLVLLANQDTGTILGTLGMTGSFKSILQGDGGIALIDSKSSDESIYLYYSVNEGAIFTRMEIRKDTDQENTIDLSDGLSLTKDYAAFTPVTAMNPNNRVEFMVASGSSESPDSVKITRNRGESFQEIQVPVVGLPISAIAWDIFVYIGNGRNVVRCYPSASLLQCETPVIVTTAPDTGIRSLAIDPLNIAIVAATFTKSGASYFSPTVFESINGGVTWANIGGTADSLLSKSSLGGAAVYVSKDQVSFLVVGTSSGVLIRRNTSNWELLAPGLPRVPVFGIVYETADDTLVIATLGRGVWFLRDVHAIASGANIGEWSQ